MVHCMFYQHLKQTYTKITRKSGCTDSELTGFGFLSGKISGHFEITYLAASTPDFLASINSACVQPRNKIRVK